MKRFILCLTLLTYSIISFAQNDPAAKKILGDISKKYKTYKTIKSDFKLTVETNNKEKFTETGVMYFNKPKNQYAIKLKDQEIISNGKSIWNISNDIKEVQISEAENDNSSIGPNNLFTFYESGYNYNLMNNESYNNKGKQETLKVIELSPLDKKTNYFKIKLRVNSNNHIHDVTIFDKSNNQYTYMIESLYLGKNLPNEYFTFDKNKYKDYETIDLR